MKVDAAPLVRVGDPMATGGHFGCVVGVSPLSGSAHVVFLNRAGTPLPGFFVAPEVAAQTRDEFLKACEAEQIEEECSKIRGSREDAKC